MALSVITRSTRTPCSAKKVTASRVQFRRLDRRLS